MSPTAGEVTSTALLPVSSYLHSRLCHICNSGIVGQGAQCVNCGREVHMHSPCLVVTTQGVAICGMCYEQGQGSLAIVPPHGSLQPIMPRVTLAQENLDRMSQFMSDTGRGAAQGGQLLGMAFGGVTAALARSGHQFVSSAFQQGRTVLRQPVTEVTPQTPPHW